MLPQKKEKVDLCFTFNSERYIQLGLPVLHLYYLHCVAACLESVNLTFHPCYFVQKAHVQQFLATEDALNKAAEARDLCHKFINRLHGSVDAASHSFAGGTTQNVSNLRQFEVNARFP